jgi:6-phosphogluconolactonase
VRDRRAHDLGAAPAQVGFSDDGDALVVTEKNTNRLSGYPVDRHGHIGARVVTPSPGVEPSSMR